MDFKTLLGQRALYEGLTRYNYFPNQKKTVGEIPPSLCTRQFTPEVVEEISKNKETNGREKSGYDLVSYRATRYNNIPRFLSIVHPAPYSRLCKHIYDNWEKIEYICENKISQALPSEHQDGRIMVMNYGDPLDRKIQHHRSAFGKKYLVKTDISNCFGSIYSHAIPWGAVGISAAKANKQSTLWYNGLDVRQRRCKRNETHGIPIGPVTSNIVVEIILESVDKKLKSLNFDFERYIDDYTLYCDSSDRAQEFTHELGKQLSELKLTLNLGKTEIIELPTTTDEAWILELLSRTPRLDQEENYSEFQAITLINQAISINKKTPDGSVLKYALQLLINKISDHTSYRLIAIVLDLAWHYPVLTPYLETLFKKSDVDPNFYCKHLLELVSHNAKLSRSDGMAWPLHIILKNKINLPESVIKKITDSKDCVAISIAQEIDKNSTTVSNFINSLIPSDNYTKDNYWLLLYQAFLKGKIKSPYNESEFQIMKNYGVSFFPSEKKSKSETENEKAHLAIASSIFENT